VDDSAHQFITLAGYREWFLHRTRHSVHEEDMEYANIDNVETQDNRRLMRSTCFSIEPGRHFKGQFGVRSEVNVYLAESEAVAKGRPTQTHITPILSPSSILKHY
jgi:Xaa-Pro aminopeptidase